MYNKVIFFVHTKKKKKYLKKNQNFFNLCKENPFLHIMSEIQEDLLVFTYFIKLMLRSKILVVCKERMAAETAKILAIGASG